MKIFVGDLISVTFQCETKSRKSYSLKQSQMWQSDNKHGANVSSVMHIYSTAHLAGKEFPVGNKLTAVILKKCKSFTEGMKVEI